MSRRIFWTALIALLWIGTGSRAQDVEAVPRRQYLEYAREAADWVWTHRDSLVEVWRSRLDPKSPFGYGDPGWFLDMAGIYAFLYDLEHKPEYAERAKHVLLTYDRFAEEFPREAAARWIEYRDGVPALPNFFTSMRYMRAYERLKRHGLFSKSERKRIEGIIAQAADHVIRTQEWGAMNRGILRAETLALAALLLPDHPRARIWKMYEEAIANDNWGAWEIEDASLYHGVWLYSLVSYADEVGRLPELFKEPEMYYYAQYFLHMMAPHGMVPDYGDANLYSNWYRFLAFLEAAATAYRDPQLKWAAATIARKFIRFDAPVKSSGLGYVLMDCYRWASDDLQPQPPSTLSCEVMEDAFGKKIVFRNGWTPESTYLLLNYQDEGETGTIFKDYLRDTIPIEEEKVTHGHADENSIVLLMRGGSFLLHDGGYRDYMPSGPYGAYRQDYFHNRLCVRQEKIWMGQEKGEARLSMEGPVPRQPLLDFLHNSGAYRQVRTAKVDFLTFPEFDYSRTRLVDDKLGYQWDRVIVYVKQPEMFVVFDVLKALVDEYFTAASLWHTRKIVASGQHWYDTVYDSLRNVALPTDHHLLILFPQTDFRLEGVEKESRYYQKELAIYQLATQHFELGENVALTTVLIPHRADEDPAMLASKVRFVDSDPKGAGVAVEIDDGERKILVAAKRDLRMDVVRDNRRPRYTPGSGRIAFGRWACNGDFLYAETTPRDLFYTAVNVTHVNFGERSLFARQPTTFGLAFDGSQPQPGYSKVRYWRDRVKR